MKSTKLLLIEDNTGDALLVQEALEECATGYELEWIRDGQEAVAYLGSLGSETDHPHLIFLDINLPKKNGLEVLSYVKAHDALKSIPVIVLTTSSSPMDIRNCYQNHANCFIIKPMDGDQFIELFRSFAEFWLKLVRLPGDHST